MAKNEKRTARTIYFTKEINEAIEKIYENSKTGESKNQIVLNCILHGLKEIYNIEI